MTEEDPWDKWLRRVVGEKLHEFERKVREIVREEMERAHVTQTGYIETGLRAGDVVGPKPKTDLERAAEIALAEAADRARCAEKHFANQNRVGESIEMAANCSSRRIADRIRLLPPSPDWRKIAEGLLKEHEYKCWTRLRGEDYADPDCPRCQAIVAYKESQ